MSERIKVAVVGSRTFNNFDLFLTKMQEIFIVADIEMIISGGARGADKMAERFAELFDIPIQVFRPDWGKHGKAAGFIRNKDIVENADVVIAFWDGSSHGTKHSMELAQKMNKWLYIVSLSGERVYVHSPL